MSHIQCPGIVLSKEALGSYNSFWQIFTDKSETRDAELAVLERKMNNDVIVLAHTRNKVEKLTADNAALERRVAADASELDKLKKMESKLKAQLVGPNSKTIFAFSFVSYALKIS